MKKFLIIAMIAALLLMTACERAAVIDNGDGIDGLETTSSVGDVTPIGGDNTTSDEAQGSQITAMPTSGQALRIPNKWVTENGAYFIKSPTSSETANHSRAESVCGAFVGTGIGDENYLLVYITDANSGNDMVLCNKPNCSHDSADCGAFLPPDTFESGGEMMIWGGNPQKSFIFADGNYLYAYNGGSTIFRMGLDGTGRVAQVKLPDKFNTNFGGFWLYDGKIYILGEVMTMREDLSGKRVSMFFEVDHKTGTQREVWVNEAKGDTGTILVGLGSDKNVGIWSGKAIFFDEKRPPEIFTQSEMETFDDRCERTIWSLDLKSGQREILFNGMGDKFRTHSNIVSECGKMLFHSRKKSALKELNLLTGEVTTLVEKLHGFINIIEEFDGRLLMWRDNNRADFFTSNPVANDFLFYDYSANKVGEVTIRKKATYPDKPDSYHEIRVLFEEDGYYYFEIGREIARVSGEYRTQKIQLGRAKADDFWEDNHDSLERLGWYDEMEFAERYYPWFQKNY